MLYLLFWLFFKVTQISLIFTDFVLTTTGTTITTHRSKTDLDLCHLCNLCELLYTNGLELTIKNYKIIFDNLWKFTGISVKYKTQIGTNDHKLSKILLLKPAGNYQFSIFNSQFNESRQANYPLSIVHYQLPKSRYLTPPPKPPPEKPPPPPHEAWPPPPEERMVLLPPPRDQPLTWSEPL